MSGDRLGSTTTCSGPWVLALFAFAAFAAGCGSTLGAPDGTLGKVGGAHDGGVGATDAGATPTLDARADEGTVGPSHDAGVTSPDVGREDTGSPGTPTPDADVAPDASSTGACYSEPYFPTVSIDDLKSAYDSSAWLATSLTVMQRRYPLGDFVLEGEKTDSQLPGFADPGAWDSQMMALMTMVHEESHGWDFDHSGADTHTYVVGATTTITVPQLPNMWPRSEIVPLLTDGVTSEYDSTYLTGEQGTYDIIFLAEELNAYINGLAAITAVGDQITSGISARDAVPAQLYWLELYLRVGRTNHPTEYAAMKADPNWQKFVRLEWARGHFWDVQAKPNPNLTISADTIWPDTLNADNEAELVQFTGVSIDVMTCTP
ncbi:MAG: hypothetical protein ACHREM_19655 [Polyangiales bacterium]